jgi:hypothetical protein
MTPLEFFFQFILIHYHIQIFLWKESTEISAEFPLYLEHQVIYYFTFTQKKPSLPSPTILDFTSIIITQHII